MKANEVREGGVYVANVSGKLTQVKLLRVETQWLGGNNHRPVRYHCRNLHTGREVTFRSAQKFRRELSQHHATTPAKPSNGNPAIALRR